MLIFFNIYPISFGGLRNRIDISREQASGGAIKSGEDGNGQSAASGSRSCPHLMIDGESDYQPLKQVQMGAVLLLDRVMEN